VQPDDRDCGFADPCAGDFGNDQWFPWIDISPKGDLNVVFHDRRLDTNSTTGEWPVSRAAPNGRPGNYLAWMWGAQCSVTTADSRQCIAPEAQVIPTPPPDFDPTGQVPGASQSVFPFKNFTISDVPFNLDYSFRAGIFMGDYNNVAVGADGTAYAIWTDSRNGRGSGGPSTAQPGRNPACEQADIFVDSFSAQSGGTAKQPYTLDQMAPFLVTPCPTDLRDKGNVTP
jgi:hypothetical protein